MIRIKDYEFSGTATVSGDNELTVVIATSWIIDDILPLTKDLDTIYSTDRNGLETAHTVTRPLSVSMVSRNVYALKFSTKKSDVQILEEKNQELSDAIDELLVLMLEE